MVQTYRVSPIQLRWGSTVLDDTPDLTGADGNYVIGVLADGLTYTITPIMTGKSFNPTSQNVLVNGSNVTGKNFVEQSGVPSGPLGSKTNPIPMNKGPNRGMVYFAAQQPRMLILHWQPTQKLGLWWIVP